MQKIHTLIAPAEPALVAILSPRAHANVQTCEDTSAKFQLGGIGQSAVLTAGEAARHERGRSRKGGTIALPPRKRPAATHSIVLPDKLDRTRRVRAKRFLVLIALLWC